MARSAAWTIPATLYLPRLRGSAYEGVTIRNVLRMCSGVAWREDNDADGRSEVHRLGRAMVSRRPGAILDLMCKLPRAHPQGAVFNYSTGESCVLAAVVAAAVGRPLADYFAETIWGPAGMEADAHWQLESEDGLELGGLGVSARLRDVGRFGLLVLEDGEAFSGRRVLPPGWRDLAGQPDCAATGFGRLMPGIPVGIRLPLVGAAAPCRAASTTAPFRRSAPTASSSTSIRPSRWSSPSRARGASPTTPTPTSRPSRCSAPRCARSDRTRRRRPSKRPERTARGLPAAAPPKTSTLQLSEPETDHCSRGHQAARR